jgi:hypothetical protein
MMACKPHGFVLLALVSARFQFWACKASWRLSADPTAMVSLRGHCQVCGCPTLRESFSTRRYCKKGFAQATQLGVQPVQKPSISEMCWSEVGRKRTDCPRLCGTLLTARQSRNPVGIWQRRGRDQHAPVLFVTRSTFCDTLITSRVSFCVLTRAPT